MSKIGKKKKILIVIAVLIALLFVVIGVLKVVEASKVPESELEIKNLKQAIEFMGAKLIKEKKSEQNGYEKDIYVTFYKTLYDGETSNQEFFYKIIDLVSKIEKYPNFRLIDEEANIIIAVKCNTEKQMIEGIYINGENDYYGKKESEKNQNTNQQTPITDLEIESNELNKLINFAWDSNTSLGTKDSSLDQYDIYFEEGIEAKTIYGKIFNIVFTTKYSQNVVNGIKVGTDFDKVIKILGEPTWGNAKENLIGYKGNSIYVFFYEDQISVYPVQKKYSTKEFAEIVQRFEQEKDLNNLLNSVMELWKDYDRYSYTDNQVFLTYTLKGIQIQFNVTNNHGILVYDNYQGYICGDITIEQVKEGKQNIPENIYLKTDTDLVYQNEKIRVNNLIAKRNKDKKDDGLKGIDNTKININLSTSSEFNLVINYTEDNKISKIELIAINQKYPNSEITDKIISQYTWYNDQYLIYSVEKDGIYLYDANIAKQKKIIEGNDKFEIKSFENNILEYDDKKVKIII